MSVHWPRAQVDEEGMRAKVKRASEERDEAQAALNRCGASPGRPGLVAVGAGRSGSGVNSAWLLELNAVLLLMAS